VFGINNFFRSGDCFGLTMALEMDCLRSVRKERGGISAHEPCGGTVRGRRGRGSFFRGAGRISSGRSWAMLFVQRRMAFGQGKP